MCFSFMCLTKYGAKSLIVHFPKYFLGLLINIKPFFSVEIEISEKVMKVSNNFQKLNLKKQLSQIQKIFVHNFYPLDRTKYQTGLELLKIKKTPFHPVNTPLIIIIFLISGIMIFKLFFKGIKNGRLLK